MNDGSPRRGWVKAVMIAVLVVLAVIVLFTWVFPWITEMGFSPTME